MGNTQSGDREVTPEPQPMYWAPPEEPRDKVSDVPFRSMTRVSEAPQPGTLAALLRGPVRRREPSPPLPPGSPRQPPPCPPTGHVALDGWLGSEFPSPVKPPRCTTPPVRVPMPDDDDRDYEEHLAPWPAWGVRDWGPRQRVLVCAHPTQRGGAKGQ